jgi:hypothetical protein
MNSPSRMRSAAPRATVRLVGGRARTRCDFVKGDRGGNAVHRFYRRDPA